MTADAIAATVALLQSEPTVTTLAGDYIYGTEAPDDPALNAAMPTYAVVVQPVGGSGPQDASYLPVDGQRIDVNCYGATPYRARLMARAVHAVLQAVARRTVTYDEAGDESDSADDVSVLIHAYMKSGGFIALREPETRWPRVLRSYVCIYSETEVS